MTVQRQEKQKKVRNSLLEKFKQRDGGTIVTRTSRVHDGAVITENNRS